MNANSPLPSKGQSDLDVDRLSSASFGQVDF